VAGGSDLDLVGELCSRDELAVARRSFSAQAKAVIIAEGGKSDSSGRASWSGWVGNGKNGLPAALPDGKVGQPAAQPQLGLPRRRSTPQTR